MTRLSGYVFDTYDDEDGQVLRAIVENQSHLPPFVKTASRLTEAQRNELPDDQFALILFDGTHKFKKYATVDKGNTALSVLYLLKQADSMPPEMVSTAARNLIGALGMYNMSVPDELVKAANKDNTKSIGTSVPGKSQKPYLPGAKVQHMQYPEILEDPKESHENPQLGRHDAAWDDVSQRTNVEGTPGSNFLELPSFPQKEKYKVAGQVFVGSDKTPETPVQNIFANQAHTKQQEWRESPYYDVSGWDPSSATAESTPEKTLLNGHYPVDGYDQVKTASVYFSENWKDLGFRDRHTYCVKLATRMSELGMDVPDNISRYGSTTYAADVESYVESRRSYVHEEAHPALDMLLEKRAQVSPGVFAEALAEFDRLNDLNWHWDGKIADPWFSTFGPSLEKVASDNWRWDGVGTRISEEDLERLVRREYHRIVKNFGADFAKEFAKSPKSVFMSLPDPNKIILARFASDQHSGAE
jgi:hypothetical protein